MRNKTNLLLTASSDKVLKYIKYKLTLKANSAKNSPLQRKKNTMAKDKLWR